MTCGWRWWRRINGSMSGNQQFGHNGLKLSSELLVCFLINMKTFVFLLAAAFCFAVGQTLTCYQCQIGFWNLCLTNQVTCQTGEQCFSGDGKAAGFVSVKMKGCLAVANCNKTTDETLSISNSSATLYKMTKTCCSTDLCNGAPGLPGTSGLSLALATISALFVANILV